MTLLKHEKNTTVAIEILKRIYIAEKDVWSLKVAWWNIGDCHEPYPMNINQRIQMSSEQLKKWHPYGRSV